MRIFISSTYEDLKEYRLAVRDAILQLGHHPVAMEYFGARPTEPSVAALEEVAKCDALVGIYAYRYGWVPENDTRSITEQEFDFAREQGIPCFCYRADRNFSWDEKLRNIGRQDERLQRFLDKVGELVVWREFTTPDNLAKHVGTDLGREFTKQDTSRVQVLLEGEFKEFSTEKQEAFIDMLAGVLHIDPNKVRLLRISPGSIVVTIQLPKDAARRLMLLFTSGDAIVNKLSIKTIMPTDKYVTVEHAEHSEEALNPMKSKPSVLWIEDSARFELRSLVGPLLFSGRYDFNLAEDVTSAMHLLRAKEYVGVIVDIRLPPGIDPEWRKHYRESGANKVHSQLGLKLLYWLLGKNPSIHSETPPAWIKPQNIGVFTVESQNEIQSDLDALGIEIFKQKSAGLPDTVLLDLINELLAKSKLQA